MAYEDPNAPSPSFDGFAQEPKSSVDQSKSFLGGNITHGDDCSHGRWTFAPQGFFVSSVDIRVKRNDARTGGGLRQGNRESHHCRYRAVSGVGACGISVSRVVRNDASEMAVRYQGGPSGREPAVLSRGAKPLFSRLSPGCRAWHSIRRFVHATVRVSATHKNRHDVVGHICRCSGAPQKWGWFVRFCVLPPSLPC